MNQTAAVQRLLDIEDIRRLIFRYFYCVDASDVEGALGCFTGDVRQEWDDGLTVVEGIASMAEWVRRYAGTGARQTHVAGHVDVEVAGDTAHAETKVLAFLVEDQDLVGDQGIGLASASGSPAGDVVRARGAGLSDDLVRTPDGWKIGRRRHRAFWQYEVESGDTAAKAHAVGALLGGVRESACP